MHSIELLIYAISTFSLNSQTSYNIYIDYLETYIQAQQNNIVELPSPLEGNQEIF